MNTPLFISLVKTLTRARRPLSAAACAFAMLTAAAATAPTPSPVVDTAITSQIETVPIAANTASKSTSGKRPATTARTTRSRYELAKRLRVKPITHTANRQNQFRVRVVAFDMLAKPPHVHINRPRFHEGIAPPDHIE